MRLFLVLVAATLQGVLASAALATDLDDDFCKKSNEINELCKKRGIAPLVCDSAILRFYTQGSYSEVNRSLRAERGGPCQKLANSIERSRRSQPLSPSSVIWRGTSRFEALDELKVGECLIDRAFLSASVSEAIGREFAEKNKPGALWRISARSARDVSRLSEYEREQEVLLGPSTPLKLISREGGPTLLLAFEEVDSFECESRLTPPSFRSRNLGTHPGDSQ